MSLRGIEMVAKISGEGAKHLAVYLFAALQGQKRTKGRIRLESLLRSGKELKVFAVKTEDLPTFCKEAKRYGVLYCALRDKKNVDGLCDVMVRAEDASKINRIVERFKLATVDTASIKQEIANTRSEKQPDESQTAQTPELNGEAPEREGSPPSVTEEVREDFLDELLGKTEQPEEVRAASQQPEAAPPEPTPPAAAPSADERVQQQTPLPSPPMQEGRTMEPAIPSVPISGHSVDNVRDSTDRKPAQEKVSIRQLLREIREENREAEKRRRQMEREPSLPKRRDRGKATSGDKTPTPTTRNRKRGKSK
ncbi:DUF3801 domain-containing protein [Paenibacillus sp. JMULE4]|nr:DUF3801 domain-containing protein [Paenibacillus sp. JMULE4]